ncbi:MAG TPA: ABC transporter ATP-binding protein, partial [Myxococcaceae bacterium]|nr:ABC transporter ATP-binding protein [Myxococcaceae bacterium]
MNRPYRRLLQFLRPYRWQTATALLAAGLSAAAAGFYARLIGPLAKAVLAGGGAELPGLPFVRLTAWGLPLWLVGTALVKAGAQWVHNGLMQSVGQGVSATLREQLYGRVLSLPPREVERHHSGELLTRLTSDVAQTEFALTQGLSSYAKDGLQTLALLATCLFIDPRLFALAFIVLPAALIPVNRFARSLKRVARELQAGVGAMTRLVAEQLNALPVVQAYRLLPQTLERFDAEQTRYLSGMRRSLTLRGAVTPTVEFLGILGTAATIGYGAWAVRAEPALAEKLLSFLAAALLMYRPAKTLSQTYALTHQSLSAAEGVFELLDLPPAPSEGVALPPLARALELDAVRVAYDADREVLRGVTLTIPAGKRVALVGASGAGKTTLFSILLRFVDWQAGRILWDGVDVRTASTLS